MIHNVKTNITNYKASNERQSKYIQVITEMMEGPPSKSIYKTVKPSELLQNIFMYLIDLAKLEKEKLQKKTENLELPAEEKYNILKKLNENHIENQLAKIRKTCDIVYKVGDTWNLYYIATIQAEADRIFLERLDRTKNLLDEIGRILKENFNKTENILELELQFLERLNSIINQLDELERISKENLKKTEDIFEQQPGTSGTKLASKTGGYQQPFFYVVVC